MMYTNKIIITKCVLYTVLGRLLNPNIYPPPMLQELIKQKIGIQLYQLVSATRFLISIPITQ